MHLINGRPLRLATPAVLATAILALLAGGLLVVAAPIAHADEHAVTVQGFAFNPAFIEVNVGDTIAWTNQDSAPHTVTDDNGSFDESLPASGGSATITFNTAGTFTYHCTIHPNMHGTVVVLAAAASPTAQSTSTAAPSSTSRPTDTAVPTTTAQPTSTTGPASASATVTRTATVIAPATGTGPGPVTSDAPLFVLLGGMLIVLGIGTGMVAFSRIRK